jgi:beta-phosphoglucomutase-like phosphatase (HAD superfamily)
VLGLSSEARARLLDLGGVLTRTAKAHAAAWKSTFDEFLGELLRSQ